MHKLFRSYGFVFALASILCAPVVAAVSWARERIDRFIGLAFDLLADERKPIHLGTIVRLFGGQRLAYDGPTIDLRHEAGTSRRSAARNI